MPAPLRTRAFCATLLLPLLAGEARAADAPVLGTILSPATAPEAPEASTSAAPAEAPASDALEVLLPCGLRVLAARDLSLPVAAVVLAVEVGTEDDPPEYPGLVHALAYHLHQGNRELRPGEAIAAAQDAGGAHFLATGPGQVRFESVVPSSRLGEVLYAESQRLRYPTVDRGRWDISLSWAASDVRPPSRLRHEQLAALHGAPGLAHEGRAINKALSGMVLGALSAQLASKFAYNRATLIVVAPEDPAAILTQVEALFRDLPPAPRVLPTRAPPPARPPLTGAPPPATGNPATPAAPGKPAAPAGTSPSATPGKASAFAPPASAGAYTSPPIPAATPTTPAWASTFLLTTPAPAPTPTPLPAADQPLPPAATPPAATPPAGPRPNFFAWPVPPNSAAGMWAGAICRALNRQKREGDEPRKARVVCEYEPDSRRGALLVRTAGADDPVALVRGRLARLSTADAALLTTQAGFVAQALRLRVRTPLGLARQLAASAATPTDPPQNTPTARDLDALTGLTSLATTPPWTLAVEDALILTPGATP